jgi:hypothetical protein
VGHDRQIIKLFRGLWGQNHRRHLGTLATIDIHVNYTMQNDIPVHSHETAMGAFHAYEDEGMPRIPTGLRTLQCLIPRRPTL